MITLGLFEKIANDGVAGLVRNKSLFWEEMPLQSNGAPASGAWIVTRSGDNTTSHGRYNNKTTVDFFVAFGNKIKTETTHQAILKWLIDNQCICSLVGEIDGNTYEFANVRIRPTSTPNNDGVTENGLIVKSASAEVIYDLT